jgi:hypothetical protein
VQIYTVQEQEAQARLFGDCPSRFIRFAKAIQLLWLVEDSVLVDSIERVDPSITYRAQLVGQLTGVLPAYLHAATDALAQLPFMSPSILETELHEVWEHSVTPVDKLAAFVVHFGRKHA